MAPHTVKHQDNNTQAVAGSMWRAEDSAERSRFVLPSGYLKRQQKTKQVVGGAGVRAAPGASPAGTHAVCMALCKTQAEATDGTWLKPSLGMKAPSPTHAGACIALFTRPAGSTEAHEKKPYTSALGNMWLGQHISSKADSIAKVTKTTRPLSWSLVLLSWKENRFLSKGWTTGTPSPHFPGSTISYIQL